MQRGLPIATDVQTVAGFLASWLGTIRSTVRPRTHESYGHMVRLHVLPTLRQERLVRLSPQQVQALLDGKLAEGLSPRTVQYLHAIIRRALTQAVRCGMLPRNVAPVVEVPRVPRAEIQPMSPAQARTLLDHVRGDRLEALYTVALVRCELRLSNIERAVLASAGRRQGPSCRAEDGAEPPRDHNARTCGQRLARSQDAPAAGAVVGGVAVDRVRLRVHDVGRDAIGRHQCHTPLPADARSCWTAQGHLPRP
jgi:hypothetical protein